MKPWSITALIASALLLTASTCSGSPGTHPSAHPSPTTSPTARPTNSNAPATPIQHVVIIIQENRTFNNLFYGFPGATTSSYGGLLVQQPLVTTWGLGHRHSDWMAAYDGGLMDGWNKQTCVGGDKHTCPPNPAYAYVQQSDIAPYWALASAYTLSDETFATQQGPSFPGHQYLIRGTSTSAGPGSRRWSENPTNNDGGCSAPASARVETIGDDGTENQHVYPCNAAGSTPSLMGLLDAAGLSWRFYQSGCAPGLWVAPYAVQNIYQKDAGNIICPDPSQVLTDVSAGNLAAVTWVTPTGECSDHPISNTGCGPSWVASVVNAVGESPFWNSTAIFVVWDDWGGWYDSVPPHIYNSFELGFRVPLIVVSPYALAGNVDHTPHEFGSILRYVETNFGLPSLGTTDARSDNLSSAFNYAQLPIPFNPVSSVLKRSYFLTHRFSRRPVDD